MARIVPDRLLREAAELRANGASWEVVAKIVQRAPDTVREWPRRFPDRWKALIETAERQAMDESSAESVHVLRTQLRSTEPDVARDAAKALIKYYLDRNKVDRAADEQRFTSTPEGVRLASFLDGHPDDELARLAAEVDPDAAARLHARAEPVDIGCAI